MLFWTASQRWVWFVFPAQGAEPWQRAEVPGYAGLMYQIDFHGISQTFINLLPLTVSAVLPWDQNVLFGRKSLMSRWVIEHKTFASNMSSSSGLIIIMWMISWLHFCSSSQRWHEANTLVCDETPVKQTTFSSARALCLQPRLQTGWDAVKKLK